METNKINVVFRKFENGEVIAIFPTNFPVSQNSTNEVLSYMHMGQHAMASERLVNELEKASETEYKPLLDELHAIGYNVSEINVLK